MSVGQAVVEERPCSVCCGRHSYFLARCLETGEESTGYWSRERDDSRRDDIEGSIASAIEYLPCCGGKHEVAS